jgi:Transposase
VVVVKDHQQREPSMGDITTIGLDLAKNVFQVHAVDEAGNVVLRKRLRRGQVLAFFAGIPSCLVGLEACATAHHWARELVALGHEARLMPPNYVKAYVKRNKHDVADAEAICEAVSRPSMRFVPLKTAEQQSALMMHRARDLLIRQRTMLVNALRGHLAEFGLIEAQGLHKVTRLITIVMDEMDGRVPDIARQVLKVIGDCQYFCVRPVIRHEFTKRSLNMTANCVFASAHSRGGRFHSAAAWFKTKYSSFVAASSEGKCPLVLMARRSFELSASMAFVV